MSILQCTRCPKALHIRCISDKNRIVKLSKKNFICDLHFKSKKDIKKYEEKYSISNPKKSKMEKAEKKRK